MFIYRGDCQYCGQELSMTLASEWDDGCFSVDCSDCDQAESLVFLDEVTGDDADEEIVR